MEIDIGIKGDNAFEEKIGKVCDCLASNTCRILHKINNNTYEICNEYGGQSFAIDHMIETEYCIIYIQDTWEEIKPSQSIMRNFINAVNYIESMRTTGMKKIILIYMSQQELTECTNDVLNSTGYKCKSINNENYYENIYSLILYLCRILKYFNQNNNDFLTKIVNEFQNEVNIIKRLYSSNLFLYENDGNAIMLNTDS